MSIGKRLIDLARSELNSLLERASQLDDDEEDRGSPDAAPPTNDARRGRNVRLQDLSDADLEAEIERRRLDREIESRGRRARATAEATTGTGTGGRTTSGREAPRSHGGASRPRVPVDPIARAYASLEVKPGSDFDTVKRAYRNMMRKYHPDRHASTPEKQKAANELAQKLTDAYRTLERYLRAR